MEQISFEYSLFCFLQTFLEFIRPILNSIFNAPNSLGLPYLTKLRVSLSLLREHKFRHHFQDWLNPICNCGSAVESTKHYFLHCSNFKNKRQSLLENARIVNQNSLSMNEDAFIHLLLYDKNTLTDNINIFLLNSVIEYITPAKRFNDPLIL